jgi:hypothetical protein
MKTLVTIIFSMFVVGCVSEYKVKEIDTKLEVKGSVGEKKLGLNDKKELILQEETSAEDELRVQQAVNFKLQEEYDREAFMLKSCRTDVSDPRLGGSGEIPPISEVDQLKPLEEVKEAIGITDEGDIKVVKKSYFVDKLKLERKYDSTLRKMTKVIKRHKEECEYKMAIARRKSGLPSERYQGEGYFQDGAWVQTRVNENSLDDAFVIQSRERAKSQPQKTEE